MSTVRILKKQNSPAALDFSILGLPDQLSLIKEVHSLDFKQSESPGVLNPACSCSQSPARRMRVSLVLLAVLLTVATLHSEAKKGETHGSFIPLNKEHTVARGRELQGRGVGGPEKAA